MDAAPPLLLARPQATARSRYEVAGGPQQRARFARWLCFSPATQPEALLHANLLCREFALGAWTAGRHVCNCRLYARILMGWHSQIAMREDSVPVSPHHRHHPSQCCPAGGSGGITAAAALLTQGLPAALGTSLEEFIAAMESGAAGGTEGEDGAAVDPAAQAEIAAQAAELRWECCAGLLLPLLAFCGCLKVLLLRRSRLGAGATQALPHDCP